MNFDRSNSSRTPAAIFRSSLTSSRSIWRSHRPRRRSLRGSQAIQLLEHRVLERPHQHRQRVGHSVKAIGQPASVLAFITIDCSDRTGQVISPCSCSINIDTFGACAKRSTVSTRRARAWLSG